MEYCGSSDDDYDIDDTSDVRENDSDEHRQPQTSKKKKTLKETFFSVMVATCNLYQFILSILVS